MANVSASAPAAAPAEKTLLSRLISGFTGRLVILVPYAWLLFFFLIPFVIVFKISLSQTAISMPPYAPVIDLGEGVSGLRAALRELSFDNYLWLTEDPLYFNAYISSVVIAGISTLLTLLVGYPIAYGMARAPASLRPTLLMLVILPFWTSFLIRVYAWIGILKPEGLLNQFLMGIGVISSPLVIMNTYTAIFIGIVYSYLPFMVLPLYASLEKLDFRLVEAGYDLYATRGKVLRRIIIPLAKPGIVAGCVLVFIPAIGAYITPLLLGGGKELMIGNLIALQFGGSRNWPFGSAAALILMAMVMIALMIYVRSTTGRARTRHG